MCWVLPERTPPCNLEDLTQTGKRGKTSRGSDMELRSVGWNHPSQLARVRPEDPGRHGGEVVVGVRAQGRKELAESGNSTKPPMAECGELGERGHGNGWAVGRVKHAGHFKSRTRISSFFLKVNNLFYCCIVFKK